MTIRHGVTAPAVLAVACFLASPPAWAKKFSLDTAPVKQGRIFVNEQFVGVAPVTVDLKVSKGIMMKARAEKDGALGLWTTEFSKDQNQTVVVRLEEDQAIKLTVMSDIANKWLTIDPTATGGPGKTIDEGEAWKKIVSIVTDNFREIEQLDRSSFYLRSAWRVRRYPYSVIRNRLIIKRGVTPNLTIRVELESQIYQFTESRPASEGIRDELFTETPRVFPEDRDTIQILRDQF
ncbi:MAG: hypothetical protein ABSH40_13920 [Bryobacteraceae bacterium]